MAGAEIEVSAEEFSSNGEDDLIEVKIGDKVVQLEKKYILVDLFNDEEPEPVLNDKVKPLDEMSIDDLEDDLEDDDYNDSDYDDDEDDYNEFGDDDYDELDFGDELDSIDDEDEDEDDYGDEKYEPSIPIITGPSKEEELERRLEKAVIGLEDVKTDIENTSTSSDTINSIITSTKGLLNSLKQDRLQK